MNFNEQKKLYRENALTMSEIHRFPRSRGLDVTVVSDGCADVIRRIHEAMNRLAPMGDDERRSLWFEVRGKRWEWYRLTTATYNDCHYLYLTGDEYDHHAICDKDNGNFHRCFWEDDLHVVLSNVERYVARLIDNILTDTERYNAYVDKYLSHYRRSGLIKRSILNSLIPDDRYDGIDIPRIICMYENPSEPTQFTGMTLRHYIQYWRIAYEAVYGEQNGDDIDVFKHSSKGYVIEDYDIDSEADFKKWKAAVSSSHGFDVVYARVHMYPVNEDGNWHFYVSTHSYWNLDECLKAVVALLDAGISVELGEVAHILGILKKTDYVEITPYAYRYMQGDNIGSQMRLPRADEIDKDTLKKIIANTEWKKIENVKPID